MKDTTRAADFEGRLPRFARMKAFNVPLAIFFMAVCSSFGYVGYQLFSARAATSNISVDFTTSIQALDPFAFGSAISTYGQNGGSIAANATQRANLGALNLGLYRVPLQWNNGNIISSAGGGPSNISGDTWINDIKSFGGTPMIVIGGSTDDNFTAQDAANMVNHFNGTNGPLVQYWVVGNEPDNNGLSMASYCTLFDAAYDAMKAARSSISVGGPAWSHYDATNLQSFLNCAGTRTDFIDFHDYAMGGTFLDNATALSQTGSWQTDVAAIRQMVNTTVPSRASQIGIQVGEYNWSWQQADGYVGHNGDDRFFQPVVTVWAASVAGHIAQAGGRGNQYSDQNGALGITFEKTSDATYYGQQVDSPMPIYYGMEMFTGGNLFRHFGTTMVPASTSLPNVEVFASSQSDNVVLINKDPSASQSGGLQLTGVTSGTADVWQTNNSAPFAAPQKVASVSISGGAVTVSLPPYTVTTLVVTPTGQPTPSPGHGSTPSPSGTPIPLTLLPTSGTNASPGSTDTTGSASTAQSATGSSASTSTSTSPASSASDAVPAAVRPTTVVSSGQILLLVGAGVAIIVAVGVVLFFVF